MRLRELEDKLLNALSGTQSNILEDEKVLVSLETLKNEAADITVKMSEADQVSRAGPLRCAL